MAVQQAQDRAVAVPLLKLYFLKKALIIFARNPVAGKVKTRLAATLGAEKALSVYGLLLQHTANVCTEVLCDRFVFYADGIPENDSWPNNNFFKMNQEGNDLGERMQQAFTAIFAKNYNQVLIIGTDCFELTPAIIEAAFTALHTYDAVIGPSEDGGYYLLGMKKNYSFLFQDKKWSTESVYKNTIQDFITHQLLYYTLPILHDIDTEADWNQYLTKNN